MKLWSSIKGRIILTSTLAISLVTTSFMTSEAEATKHKPHKPKRQSQIELRIMGTTDIHTNLLSYDYYKDSASPNIGLAKTATLVKKARSEVKNSVLVDNGDLIQGTPLGTYKAKIDPLEKRESCIDIRIL